MEFNPFMRMRSASPKPERKMPATLKPFVPVVTERVLDVGGFIRDWDYDGKDLFLVYNDDTYIVYRGIRKDKIDGLLEGEARRFFAV